MNNNNGESPLSRIRRLGWLPPDDVPAERHEFYDPAERLDDRLGRVFEAAQAAIEVLLLDRIQLLEQIDDLAFENQELREYAKRKRTQEPGNGERSQ